MKRDLITLDFETAYSKEYSLSKMTTEEYVRSDKFEAIGVAVKVNDQPAEWGSGSHKAIQGWLESLNLENSILLCHNTIFDGFILSDRFGIHAHAYLDTLSMARAIHGIEVGGSLAKLAEHYAIGKKGTEVLNAIGKWRSDFSKDELQAYGDYCVNDVELTYELFRRMTKAGFPRSELKLIDLTLKMFIRPKLILDKKLLNAHYDTIQSKKRGLLFDVEADKDALMSNSKFVDELRRLGVEPPMKISPTTGKKTFALSKNDAGFKALEEHPNVDVQMLVAARLGLKSTLEETRTERFMAIAERGPIPVPLKYYAAHTGRWGGSDKINFQNLPARGESAGKLKNAICAPDGYLIIDSDSSQIEARVLAWLAEQNDLVAVFANNNIEIAAGVDKKNFKYDPYKLMASTIYNKPVEEITDSERFVGKTTILGAGYGMGATKFQIQLKTFGVDIREEEAHHIIKTYRETYPKIAQLWRQANTLLDHLCKNSSVEVGRKGVLTPISAEKAIKLPNNLLLKYHDLHFKKTDDRTEYLYRNRNGLTKIYGGKVVENLCQAIARCVIGEQMILIAKKYDVVLTVHDAIACVVREDEVEEAQEYVEECMRWVPDWARGLPVNCESGYGRSYGDC